MSFTVTSSQAAVSSNTISVNAPSGATTGDTVIVVVAGNTTATLSDGGDGFTKTYQNNSESAEGSVCAVFIKDLDGTEGSTYTFNSTATDRLSAIAFRFSGAVTYDVTPVDGNTQVHTGLPTTHTSPSISVADNSMHIICDCADTGSYTISAYPSGDGYTQAENISATGQRMSLCYLEYASAGSTGTHNFTISSGTNGYVLSFSVVAATTPQTATPSADTYNSDGWTDESAGSSNIYTHIDESSYSDSDYIRSAADPSSDAYVTKLTSLTDPSSSSGHTLHARYGKDSAGGDTNSLVIQLRQGYTNEGSPGTLIATALNNSDISSGWTAVDYDLSGAEADSISDYTDLYVRMVANKEAAGSSTATFCCYEKTNSNATATSSLSVNKPTSGSTGPSPANVASGDLLIILCGNDDNTNTAQWNDTTLKPTGFTMINEVGNSTQDAHCAAFYKIADGTEGASFSWSSQSSDNYWAYCVLIKNVDGTTPIPQIGADSVDSTPPLTISAITTTSSEPDCLVFAIAAFDGGDPGGFTWSGTGWSEVDDNLPSSSSSAYASGTWGMYQYSGYGATPAVTATMSGTSDGMVGFMFAIKPGSGGATTRRSQVSWVQLEVPEAAGTTHNLLADDVESDSEVTSPAVGQVHGLLADDVQSTSEVSAPSVGQVHALLADDVQSTSEVSAPVLLEVVPLLADDVESASELSTPSIGQVHGLTADDVESTSEVSAPSVGQVHGLLANDVESTSEVTLPAVGQVHGLSADDVESTSELSAPVLGQSNVLLADDVESASELTTPAITQVHGLLADDVQSTSEVSAPAVGQIHGLLANDVESASNLSLPVLVENAPDVDNLLADDVESASELSAPAVGQIHALLADDVQSTSNVTSPAVGQVHELSADDVESSSELTLPVLTEVGAGVHNLLAEDVESASSVSSPTLSIVVVPSGAGGRPSRQRRKRIIVDDTLYNVTEAEEAQILRDYIESLKEEKQEVQKEVSKARKLVKKAKAQTENKPKPLYQPTKSTISSLLNELKRIEEKRKDAIRRYNAIMAEMEDEEDAISIILTMGGL